MRILLGLIILAGALAAKGARLELVTSVPLEKARQIEFQGDRAWVAQNFDGAALLDVKDPLQPKLVKQFPGDVMMPVFLRALGDDLLLSADRFRGLVIYDVKNADSPTTVSVMPLPPMTTMIDVTTTTDGKRLAVLSRTGEGLLCVDISDVKAPAVTDRFTTGVEFTRATAMADGLVYVADSAEGGMKVLRLVSPGRFEALYRVNLSGSCESLLIHDGKLFAGYSQRGFRIYELPDVKRAEAEETTPILRLLSYSLRNRSHVRDMAAAGTLVVSANDENGVDLYDVKNPELPWLCDEFVFRESGPLAQGCAVYRGAVFVPAWEAGLFVFRITDEASPAEFNLENLTYDDNKKP